MTSHIALVTVEGRVIYGALFAHLLIYKVFPSRHTIAVGVFERGVGIVAQLVAEGHEGITVVGTRRKPIVHLCRLTAIAHKGGNSLHLRVGVSAVIISEHIVPVEGRGSPCCDVDLVGRRGICR